MYLYPLDSDSYVLGVPARDLTDDDFAALSPEDQARVRALYAYAPQETTAPAEQENN